MKIEDMDLSPVARHAAELLQAEFPEVVFTSGRRDLAGQARAMASNVVSNREWIAQTYKDTPQRHALQACVNDCPAGATQAVYGEAMLKLMQDWDDEALSHVSKHLSGDAFDVQPFHGGRSEAVKARLNTLPGKTLFLEREGGLERWHVQFA